MFEFDDVLQVTHIRMRNEMKDSTEMLNINKKKSIWNEDEMMLQEE